MMRARIPPSPTGHRARVSSENERICERHPPRRDSVDDAASVAVVCNMKVTARQGHPTCDLGMQLKIYGDTWKGEGEVPLARTRPGSWLLSEHTQFVPVSDDRVLPLRGGYPTFTVGTLRN